MQAWHDLLREATVSDYDEQQYALFRVGLVLERHNQPNQSATYYEDHLSRELLRLTLDDKRQGDVVDMLVALVRANLKEADTALYTLSKAKPIVLATPLLHLLRDVGAKLPAKAAYQAVVALDVLIKSGVPDVTEQLQRDAPIALLGRWSEHDDEMLSIKAKFVLERLQDLNE